MYKHAQTGTSNNKGGFYHSQTGLYYSWSWIHTYGNSGTNKFALFPLAKYEVIVFLLCSQWAPTSCYLRLINIVPWALLVWVCILQICWLSSCRQKRRTSSVSFTGCFDTFIFRSLLYTWVPMAIARFTTEFETTNQFRVGATTVLFPGYSG